MPVTRTGPLREEKLVNSHPPKWESVFLEEGYIDPQEGYKYPFEYKIHKVITLFLVSLTIPKIFLKVIDAVGSRHGHLRGGA